MIKDKKRIEKDFLGQRELPGQVYYGIQTLRASENFPVSGLKEDKAFVKAYAKVKCAACVTNQRLEAIDDKIAGAIIQAAQEIISGKFHDQFIVDVFQAGAGTSFNMNVNEVIANRALEISGKDKGDYAYINPHDHVNYAQSTNDTFPTAINLAALDLWATLQPILENLAGSFEKKGKEFHHILKAGRTHLQDAVPLRLGQEFRAYGYAIRRSIRLIHTAVEELKELPIGGTATGTALNTPPNYQKLVVEVLSQLTGFALKPASDLREAMQSRQAVGAVSGALKVLALELTRIANDLRLLSSGPATGLAEIELPAVQPGSSIMPAKVNPVMAECLNMVAFQIIGNDNTISLAIQAGQLELNVMMPLMAYNLLQSFRLLINYLPVFTEKCLLGIVADPERCNNYAYSSTALGTVLNPIFGYRKTAELIKEALTKGKKITDLVAEKKLLSGDELNELLKLDRLTGEK
jgi:aspartate ammonia-lyase